MKSIKKYISLAAGAMLFAGLGQSCISETPFGLEGEGTLRMKFVLNSDLTRAETDQDALRSSCVVYISSEQGLIHKYKDLATIPEALPLKSGNYVIEAWAGDSVAASFDKKFYSAYQPMTVETGAMVSQVVTCRIANVVVSVNPTTVDADLMKNWNITVSNTKGSLVFNEENYGYQKGYYMMPQADKELTVTVAGTTANGNTFTKTQKILNPKKGHEYVLNLAYNPVYDQVGGSFVNISVDDTEILVESEVELFARPAFKGADFNVDNQIVGNAGAFTDKIVKVSAFGGLKSMRLLSDDYAAFGLPTSEIDLLNVVADAKADLNDKGLRWDNIYNASRNLATSYITFGREMLNRMPERDQEYQLTIEATDTYGKSTSQMIRIAVGEGAVVIDDPVVMNLPASDDHMAILSKSATLTGSLVNAGAETPGVEYRASGSQTWMFMPLSAQTRSKAAARHLSAAQALRAKGTPFTVTLTGLQPGTRYEYRAASGDFRGESMWFTTEGTFTIPNASMESWSNYVGNSKVRIASADGQSTFWDSGNHGSSKMSVTLTDGSSDMAHSGSLSAKLRSQFVGIAGIGKFAAGNLFSGVITINGTNGIVDFGRSYDGSHPSSLRLWANYRPGTAQSKGAGDKVPQGTTDFGQIYVAITSGTIQVDTTKPETFVTPENAKILGYGQVTWNEAFGPDGSLQVVNIPITYRAAAKTVKPTHIIIVCTASKYGDYFQGGEGSTLYVDDFELTYE